MLGDVGRPKSPYANIVKEALARYYSAAVLPAERTCAEAQSSWLTLPGTKTTICNAAAQHRLAYDDLTPYIDDPGLTYEKSQEILQFVQKYSDVSGLTNLLNSSNIATITGDAILETPGTAIGLAAKGAGTIVGGAATGLFKTLPWWVYPIGGLAVLFALGWQPLKR